jgi:hypothetical protein
VYNGEKLTIYTMSNERITKELVQQLFFYEEETGKLFWKIKPSGPVNKGDEAGRITSNGYRQIRIFNSAYVAHRIVWLYINGNWPKNYIDHINGDRLDNRISNLREVTKQENNQNLLKAQKNNKSNFLGVSWNPKGKKWRAQICVDNKKIYLGLHETPELAHAAYLDAKRKLHKGNLL